VRRAEQQDRELVTSREHELQVGDHPVRPRGIGGRKLRPERVLAREQLRQGEAAEVLWQAGLHARSRVQLGHRSGQTLPGADLEEAGEGLCRGVGRVAL
jgi:hypothetical protein